MEVVLKENQCICTVWEGDGCTQVHPSDVIVMLGPKMQLQRSKYIYPFLILLYFLLCHYVSSLIQLGFCTRLLSLIYELLSKP
ncbi:hypothetical protein HanHA300_Chr03g0088891 [Helianthus annuus]|nr:hypothetical protein HanHA300_Chr03g0088891 [Helianthus annuus]KAJ0600410.1 hypothetical protein HanIR_Chr03g0116311 [Helianthus annuus]KAJ0607755.1 hypothetical protein HanHA89_Chr03g0100481 [Helianthus annuus]KAJ0767819.1 hypothetical protein HanLR1_Chr03g0093851 [Helianthus annuus]